MLGQRNAVEHILTSCIQVSAAYSHIHSKSL